MRKWMLVLALCLALSPTVLAADWETRNCREMTDLWFGETAALMDWDETGNTVSAYFSDRESAYAHAGEARLFSDAPASPEVQAESRQREAGVLAMEQALALDITDAAVTVRIDEEHRRVQPDGTVVLYAYEWTFFDYDDLSDGPGGSDVSGFGTWHKLTLAPDGQGGYVVQSDEYDETDILGVCTIREETRANPEEAAFLPDHFLPTAETGDEERFASLMDVVYFADYDPDKAAEYADQFVNHSAVSGSSNDASYYNPAYYNFNPLGGDCANYTSQCIYAGGMPQVVGSPYGMDGWFYKSANNRSASWTGARNLCTWMAGNRGVLMETASDTNIYKGSPVFYNNRGHATICVGKNSAGTPIINSHNSDRYHVTWRYWNTTVCTVQLTAADPLASSGGGTEYGPLSIANVRAPSGHLIKGEGFGLRGLITSDNLITRVSAAVYNVDHTRVLFVEETVNSHTYNIQTGRVNNDLIFNSLPAGSYTYVVSATDTASSKTLVSSSFYEGTEDTLSISGETYPATLSPGQSFDLRGVIASRYLLKTISASVTPASGGNAVLSYAVSAWNSGSYDIQTDGVNDQFAFQNLPSGDYIYTVRASDEAGTEKALLSQRFTITQPAAHTHTLGTPESRIVGIAPTCTTGGQISCFLCQGCGRYFQDVNGTRELSMDQVILPAAGHSFENGVCTVCGLQEGAGLDGADSAASSEPSGGTGSSGGTENGTPSSGGTLPSAVLASGKYTYADGTITVSASVNNTSAGSLSANVWAAVYLRGRMADAALRPVTLSAGSAESVQLTLNCSGFTEADAVVRLFLLDSASVRPLSAAVTASASSAGNPGGTSGGGNETELDMS